MFRISLKAERINANLSICDAADLIGVSESTLKSWEAGRTFPTQPHITKLCEVYGLSYDQIRFNI